MAAPGARSDVGLGGFARWSGGELPAGLDRSGLSARFDPFLPHFAREAVAAGADVWFSTSEGRLSAMYLDDRVESTGSVFTYDRRIAERLVLERPGSTYAEHLLDVPHESFDLYSARLADPLPLRPFRHEVRRIEEGDRPAALALLRESYPGSNVGYFSGPSDPAEVGFRVRLEEEVVGVAWGSVAGSVARLHSLTVRPGARRLGVATDLLHARILWARAAGLREAFSEISEENVPSRTIAERAGLRPTGRIHLYRGR